MIAVDASALIAFFLREEGWRKLSSHMRRVVTVDQAVKEFLNALWKATYLRGFVGAKESEEVLRTFKEYLENNVIIEPEEELLDRSFEISIRHGITVYDSLYIALSLRRQVPLLTLDLKQKKVASSLGIPVLP